MKWFGNKATMRLLFKILIPTVVLFTVLVARAEKAGIKISDVDASQDTSITIKKGVTKPLNCVAYEIVSESEEITGEEKFDRKEARESWKEACEGWKRSVKELNKDNSMIKLSCGSLKLAKNEDRFTASSVGTYKVKVKIQDKVVE